MDPTRSPAAVYYSPEVCWVLWYCKVQAFCCEVGGNTVTREFFPGCGSAAQLVPTNNGEHSNSGISSLPTVLRCTAVTDVSDATCWFSMSN